MSRPTRRGSGSSPKKGKGSPTKEGPNEKIGIPTTSDNTEENASGGEAFERELAWCIERLEAGLLASKSKLPNSQTHEAVRILKVLRNTKSPYVKKRQYMRSSFGDYRQKMEEEAKRYASKTKKISMKSANTKDQKCMFIKRSTHHGQESSATNTSPFCFNFDVDPESQDDKDYISKSSDLPNDHAAPPGAVDIAHNIFKMEHTDNSFKFNFNTDLDKT